MIEFKDPKTEALRRTVPLDAETVVWLKEHRRRLRELKMQFRPDRWTDEFGDLAFPCTTPFAGSPAGRPWQPGSLRKAFHTYAVKVGLGTVRFHDLRHIYGHYLRRGGAPLEVVKVILGHEKIATTADTYGHVVDEQRHEAAAVLNGLWGEGSGGDA